MHKHHLRDMASSKFIVPKKKIETVKKIAVVSTQSISKLLGGLVDKLKRKTENYGVMITSLEEKIAVVEKAKIRTKRYKDRLVAIADQIRIVEMKLAQQVFLDNKSVTIP
jgi:hypothetical protein